MERSSVWYRPIVSVLTGIAAVAGWAAVASANGDHSHAAPEGGPNFLDGIGLLEVWIGLLLLASVGALVGLRTGEGTRRSGTEVAAIVIALLLGVTAVFIGYWVPSQPSDPGTEVVETYGPGEGPLHMEHFYAEAFDPDAAPRVADVVRDPAAIPPPLDRNRSKTVTVTLDVRERVAPMTEGAAYYYWTYNGTVPGPILRVREGDTVVLTLRNEAGNSHDHSIDLHAANGPGGGATMTEVEPGEERTIRFTASNAGFYLYHCGSENVPTHVANQLVGGIIVEPRDGLPPVDREFVVMQGELYTTGALGAGGFQPLDPERMLDESPTYYAFNGRPGGVSDTHEMRATAGETVRIYFANGGIARTSSLHLIGEQFERVWRHGSFETSPTGPGVQTVPVAAGSGAVIDVPLDAPGRYVLVDHALARTEHGAWGVLNVTGGSVGRRRPPGEPLIAGHPYPNVSSNRSGWRWTR